MDRDGARREDRETAWERVAFEGGRARKRHIKSTYASPHPSPTQGRRRVLRIAGLHAFSVDGTPLWSKDLGRMVLARTTSRATSGARRARGPARGRVIVQVDTSKETSSPRSTPRPAARSGADAGGAAVVGTRRLSPAAGVTEVVTNSSTSLRLDSRRQGTVCGSAAARRITAPTPIFAPDAIIVTSGRRPVAPFSRSAGGHGRHHGHASVLWQKVAARRVLPTPVSMATSCTCWAMPAVRQLRLPHGDEVYRCVSRTRVGLQRVAWFRPDAFTRRAKTATSSSSRRARYSTARTERLGEPIMATPAIAGATLSCAATHAFARLEE